MAEYVCEVIEPPAFDSYHKIAFLQEVVRCKDCVYSEETLSGINGYICVRINDPRCWLSVGAGGFCAWGKRREKFDGFCAWTERREK